MNLKSHFATVAAIAVLGGYAATALPNANAQLSPIAKEMASVTTARSLLLQVPQLKSNPLI